MITCLHLQPLPALRGNFSSFGSNREQSLVLAQGTCFPITLMWQSTPSRDAHWREAGSGENSLEPWTSSLYPVISAFRKAFLFWGVILQRADMHQREVVRENIQGRLLVLLAPFRDGSRNPDSQQFRAGRLQLHAHSSGPGGPGGTISDHAWRPSHGRWG